MSTYEASVSCTFSAAHAIPAAFGRLEESHEHEWGVTATFRSPRLDEKLGVVIDFVAARKALEEIAASLDQTDLNTLDAFAEAPPSAEQVAKFFAEQLEIVLWEQLGGESENHAYLYRLAVTEAPNCTAAFYGDEA